MKLSVIVPVFNEEEVLLSFYKRLKASLNKDFKKFNYEIIFVNDGSIDKTQNIIEDLSKKDKNIRYIEFASNSGQHSAIFAGLKKSSGDLIVVTDADLQDKPEEIINLYKKINKKYNIIYSVRRSNNYPLFKKITSLIFWKTLKYSSGLRIPENQSMLKIFDRDILENVLAQEEINPFLPIIFARSGLKQTTCLVKNDARTAGKSKYSLNKMIKLASNAIFYYSFMRILVFLLLVIVIFNIFMILLINNYISVEILKITYLINVITMVIIIFLGNSFYKRTNLKIKKRFQYVIKNSK